MKKVTKCDTMMLQTDSIKSSGGVKRRGFVVCYFF
nr:MAG TPA: hypothetical protein [Bacteriophage sp.]